MGVAVAASLCYGGILWGVRLAVLPPQALAEVPYLPEKQLHYSMLLVAVACGSVALIGSYFAESACTGCGS